MLQLRRAIEHVAMHLTDLVVPEIEVSVVCLPQNFPRHCMQGLWDGRIPIRKHPLLKGRSGHSFSLLLLDLHFADVGVPAGPFGATGTSQIYEKKVSSLKSVTN
jgi:hypothetical protein